MTINPLARLARRLRRAAPAGNVPTMPGLPYLGVTHRFFTDPLRLYSDALKLGDIVELPMRRGGVLTINHPALVRHVLVDAAHKYRKSDLLGTLRIVTGDGIIVSEGERWRRQRSRVQPAFAGDRMAGFARTTTQAIAAHVAKLDRHPDGATIDALDAVIHMSIDVLLRSLFASQIEVDHAALTGAVKVAMREVILQAVIPATARIPRPGRRRFAAAMIEIGSLIDRLLAEHRARRPDLTGDLAGDLIDMLLAGRDAETGAAMPETDLRNELITLFIAGHDTVASALAWSIYLLSCYPAVARQLEDEVDRVVGQRPLAVDDVPKLAFTKCVFQETLRLYPQPPVLLRKAIEDDVLGGVAIPAGAELRLNVYAIQRDPRFCRDPEVFDPGRFSDERRHERPTTAYLPFGLGARACVGARFATLEGTVALAALAQRFHFEPVAGHEVHADLVAALQPRGGLPIIVRKRQR
jgi:cytochrome P450